MATILRTLITALLLVVTAGTPSRAQAAAEEEAPSSAESAKLLSGPLEFVDDPFVPVPPELRITSPARRWSRNGRVSVQVNVDAEGNNIVGDAANEPSIAVDPTNPSRMAIGWRQFDTVTNNFRQAGWGFTADGGQTWTFPGVLDPGVFRSDPILDFDSDGNFYYNSLGTAGGFCTDVFKSLDGGQSWGLGVFAFGGDKAWMGVDRSGLLGDGHIYGTWNSFFGCSGSGEFNRSTDGGTSFETPVDIPQAPVWGTIAVGPLGETYVTGNIGSQFAVAKSTTARDPGLPVTFDFVSTVDLGGTASSGTGPNPGGLLGQAWVAAAPGLGPGDGTVYVLSSVNPPGADPLDVHFARSTDGGLTWSSPVRVNDDLAGNNAWQWFGTMSVAPDGRIDVIWNDTRNDPGGFDSELFYAFSQDGGLTWSANEAVSPPFDPHLGWPNQSKLGDYYDMVSDLAGAHLAYAATFNGEQDVYYLRLVDAFVFQDGFESGDTSAWSATVP
jgi:hypothetical protein